MHVLQEIQIELDRLRELQAAQLKQDTPEARAEIQRIRERIERKLKEQRELEMQRIVSLGRGQTDLIPLRLLAQCAAIEGHKAELQESKKDIAAYESGRSFIRAVKRAIESGRLVAREQGLGVPIDLSAWCEENDTLLPFEKMMPHPRVMVRVQEARAWMESIGAQIPAWLLVYGTMTKENLDRKRPAHSEPVTRATTAPAPHAATEETHREQSEETPKEIALRYVREHGGRKTRGVQKEAAELVGRHLRTVRKWLDEAEENSAPNRTDYLHMVGARRK